MYGTATPHSKDLRSKLVIFKFSNFFSLTNFFLLCIKNNSEEIKNDKRSN